MSSPHGPYGDQGGAPQGPPPPQPQTGYGIGTGVFYAGILLALSCWFALRKAGD